MENTLFTSMVVKTETDKESRLIHCIGTKEQIDRDGEIIKVNGMSVVNYKKNPVVLFGHNHSLPAIGKTTKIWKEKNDKELHFNIEFATADVNPMADTIFKLYKGGFMKSFSIGFIPDFKTVEYPKTDKVFRVVNDSELIEISAVNVPANTGAVIRNDIMKAFDASVISKDECDSIMCMIDKNIDELIIDKQAELDKQTDISNDINNDISNDIDNDTTNTEKNIEMEASEYIEQIDALTKKVEELENKVEKSDTIVLNRDEEYNDTELDSIMKLLRGEKPQGDNDSIISEGEIVDLINIIKGE